MAGPMVWLLLVSSVTILRSGVRRQIQQLNEPQLGPAWKLPELALPQLTLVVAAMTSFHVQIVNRIASAYPAWYATIGSWIVEQPKLDRKGTRTDYGEWVVRGIIIYGLVQGSLFAGFLPPA
jgi:GPI mannosyltransferase 2